MFKHMLLLCLLVLVTISLCACQGTIHIPLLQEPTDEPIVGPCTAPPSLPGELVYLSFSERSSYFKRVQGYDFRTEDGVSTAYFWMAGEDEPYPVPVDDVWVAALTDIVQRNNMILWDGFSESDSMLLDGTHFYIALEFSDGTTVNANGYGCFPENYGNASKAIDALFLHLLPEEMRDW